MNVGEAVFKEGDAVDDGLYVLITGVSKETYYSVKRDLLQCQKIHITVSKETYYSVKRDLLQCQKRPITVSDDGLYVLIKGRIKLKSRGSPLVTELGRGDILGEESFLMNAKAGEGMEFRSATAGLF
jgi:CRP-like cAMP-binding protein